MVYVHVIHAISLYENEMCLSLVTLFKCVSLNFPPLHKL